MCTKLRLVGGIAEKLNSKRRAVLTGELQTSTEHQHVIYIYVNVVIRLVIKNLVGPQEIFQFQNWAVSVLVAW